MTKPSILPTTSPLLPIEVDCNQLLITNVKSAKFTIPSQFASPCWRHIGAQIILNDVVWISWSPSSELIVDVNSNVPAPGFINTLLNVTLWEFPLVTLLLSATFCAVILIPGLVFETVKLPNTCPSELLTDWIIAWSEDIIEDTIKRVLKVNCGFWVRRCY